MMVTVYEERWSPTTVGRTDVDPSRIAQGILTGIGFLGAGTIMKDGLTVSGLTTAASIWMTASIGILMGIGFYSPAIVALLLTFSTLSLFRWIESSMPSLLYAQLVVRFPRDAVMPEADLRHLLDSHGFSVSTLNYHVATEGDFFEYRGIVRTSRQEHATRLSQDLTLMPTVKEFRLWPTGD
jgi:putative Mg2+ transporter-C (MgtC) family protein